MKLYDFPASHNCYKVRLLLSLLNLEYEKQPVDLMRGENRTSQFLKLNPRGQVPVLQDGESCIWDSSAILVYLARRYGQTRWWPDDALAMAQVMQWLAVAQNELLYGVGRAHWLRRGGTGNLAEATTRGERGLRVLNERLGMHTWLACECSTIADIACYPHASLAAGAGIPLDDYPNIRRWAADVEKLEGYVDIGGSVVSRQS